MMMNPYDYYIYKEGATTHARRGNNGSLDFSSSDSKTVIQQALDGAHAELGHAVLQFGPQTFDLAAQQIVLGAKSNLSFTGCGIDKTIFLNGEFSKSNTTPSSDVTFSDFTINAQGQCNNCINLGTFITDARLTNIKAANSFGGFIFHWSHVNRMIVDKCIFINDASNDFDNVAGGQDETNENETIFRNCYFQKNANNTGGGMLTTGQTGNVLVVNCTMRNAGTASSSYAAFSAENQTGNSKQIRIINCRGFGPNMGFQIGNDDADVYERGMIINTISNGILAIRGAKEAIVANCMVYDSESYGIYLVQNDFAKVSNCIVRNTTMTGSASLLNRAGVYANNNEYLEISQFSCIDDQSTATTPYGIVVRQSLSATPPSNEVRITDCELVGPFTEGALVVEDTDRIQIRGGRVVGSTNFDGSPAASCDIRNLIGFNPVGPTSITVGASPFTYTNSDRVPEMVHIFGGTVSSVSRSGTQIANTTNVHTWLDPGQTVVVTYSSTPTMVRDRK